MEEQPLPPAPSTGSALINVFTAPGEAFTNLHTTESKPTLWILPLLASIAAVIILMIIGYTNQDLKSQRLDATRTALEQRVSDGKMTQEQLDRMMEGMEKGGGIVLAIQIISVIIVSAIFFFFTALILWLGAKTILKVPVGYEKILELSGIASWISVLGVFVQALMMVGLNSIYAHPSLSIFIYQSFDITNSTHKVLSLMNFFSIWQTIVIGIGLQKWSQKGMAMPMVISFAAWLLIVVLMLVLGFAG